MFSFAGVLLLNSERNLIELTPGNVQSFSSENPYPYKNESRTYVSVDNYFINITIMSLDIDGSSGDFLLIHTGELLIIKNVMCAVKYRLTHSYYLHFKLHEFSGGYNPRYTIDEILKHIVTEENSSMCAETNS